MAGKKKGIYCLEGLWSSSVKDRSTIQPILELMEKRDICTNIHHSCATKEELIYFLDRWKASSIKEKFPILYFGFHGKKECICLAGKEIFTLKELGGILENSAIGKVF